MYYVNDNTLYISRKDSNTVFSNFKQDLSKIFNGYMKILWFLIQMNGIS